MNDSFRVELKKYEGFEEEFPFDCSDGRGGYVLFTPNGAPLRVSTSAYRLLRSLHQKGSSFTIGNEESRGDSQVRLEGVALETLRKIDSIHRRSSRNRRPWGFWIRWPLVSQQFVNRVASFASTLYHPAAFAVLGSCVLAVALVTGRQALSARISQGSIMPGYILFLASLIVHEFGHAAACARYGAKPSEIGFTIYLIYPAFYSNVNSCWKLSRWKRVLVDLGGSYFQFTFGAGLLAVYYWTHWEPLRVAFVMTFYMTVFCLNPIFRFDGYWVLADALGVANLSQQPWLITKYCGQRVLRRPTDRLPWSASTIFLLMIYTVASILIWARFTFDLVPALSSSSVRLYILGKGLLSETLAGNLPGIKELFSLGMAVYFSVILCVMVYRMGVLVKSILRDSIKRRSTDRTAVVS